MKYVAGFIITIFLLILAFVLIFRGGDDSPRNAPAPLADYATTNVQVRQTIDYPVSANQTHNRVVVTVGRDAASLTYEQGYLGNVIRSQTYENNATAYGHFLRALQIAGYTNGDNSPNLRDERGVCPDGRRFIYEIVDGSRTIQRYWSTTCGNIGSFKGKTTTVNNLFMKQIPDYGKLTAGTGSVFF